MDESKKHRDFPFVTNDQPPKVPNPADRSFDFPAALVPSQFASVLPLRFPTVPPVRANQLNPSLRQAIPKRGRIGGLIVNQPLRILSGPAPSLSGHRHLFQGALDQRDLVGRRRGQLYSQRNTLAACYHHKLRTLAAFGLADACAPFFAGANVPSANVSSQFSRPLASNSPRKARQTFSQIPCVSQSRKRRQQVLDDGYRLGKSFQRAPLRNTQRMPSKHGRLGIGVRPPLGDGFTLGNNGAIFAHCLSVSSDSCRAIGLPPEKGCFATTHSF